MTVITADVAPTGMNRVGEIHGGDRASAAEWHPCQCVGKIVDQPPGDGQIEQLIVKEETPQGLDKMTSPLVVDASLATTVVVGVNLLLRRSRSHQQHFVTNNAYIRSSEILL